MISSQILNNTLYKEHKEIESALNALENKKKRSKHVLIKLPSSINIQEKDIKIDNKLSLLS